MPFYLDGLLTLIGILVVVLVVGIPSLISLARQRKWRHLLMSFTAGGMAPVCLAMKVCSPVTPHYPCWGPLPSTYYVVSFFGASFVAAFMACLYHATIERKIVTSSPARDLGFGIYDANGNLLSIEESRRVVQGFELSECNELLAKFGSPLSGNGESIESIRDRCVRTLIRHRDARKP